MPLTGTLHLLAELAVAFAGFASLVSIVGSRRGRDAPEIDASRIRGMLEASLLVAAFAIIPILSHEAGLSISVAWQVSAGLFAVSVAIIVVLQARRSHALRGSDYRATRYWQASAASLWLACLGALLSTAMGTVENAAFGYTFGLFAFLVYAGLLFIRLVSSLLSASQARDGPAA